MPSLSSHPIFQVDDGLSFSQQEDERRNIVAFKGTEVYIAVGSTVRYAELREWYAMDNEPKDEILYQTLEFPSITFDIQELVWNQYGTHLALVGQHELAIITFPRLGLTGLVKSEKLPPKVVQIGKSIYSHSNSIKKVLFHPQSKHDNTVVVLSSDSHLRVFELSLSPHVPEQDLPLFPQLRRGYTVDFDIPVPVSFTFGVGSEWAIWTIFILTRDGDIYILCPIMPTKCAMTRSAVSKMKTLISYRADAARSNEDCTLAERETCLNQTRWIGDILGQISMGDFMGVTQSPAFTGIETGDMVSFKRPNKVRPTPEIQGPVLFQPAPTPMDTILPEGSDITFLDADGVGVLVTTWMGGRVDIGVLIDGIEGVWSVKGVSREEFPAIRLAAYESVDLPVSGNQWTGILKSQNDTEGVFIAAGNGIWQIDFRGWLQELRKLDQPDLNEAQAPFELKSSAVNLMVRESSDIVGYGLLFDPLLDYHLLTISSEFHSKFTELALPTLASSLRTTRSSSPVQSRRTTKPATYLAYPFPDDTALNSPGRAVLSGLRIPQAILREKDPVSTEAIKLLGEITVRIRNVVIAVLRVGEGLRQRLELQHKELEAQLSKLSSTHNSVKELQDNATARDLRLKSITETQTDLESRANVLLRKLVTINQPQTSEAEEKWFKELTRVKSRLEGQRGLMTEVKTRMAEGRKYIELANKRNEAGDEVGVRKLDGRVMEAVEEATRKIERLKMKTARLSSAC